MSSLSLRKRFKVKTLFLILLSAWLFVLMALPILNDALENPRNTVGDALLDRNVETASANAVTSVVVSYRGFDTLGEVTVLFLASTGIGLFFGTRTRTLSHAIPEPNEMMQTGIRLLFPVLLLFGVYIIVHGHLSPGGGFQGGVIIATAFFLRMLAQDSYALHHGNVSLLESFSGSSFVLFGLFGLAVAGTFLGNFLPHSKAAMGTLISAGVIPVIYILVGIKVGSEVSAIFQDMLEREEA